MGFFSDLFGLTPTGGARVLETGARPASPPARGGGPFGTTAALQAAAQAASPSREQVLTQYAIAAGSNVGHDAASVIAALNQGMLYAQNEHEVQYLANRTLEAAATKGDGGVLWLRSLLGQTWWSMPGVDSYWRGVMLNAFGVDRTRAADQAEKNRILAASAAAARAADAARATARPSPYRFPSWSFLSHVPMQPGLRPTHTPAPLTRTAPLPTGPRPVMPTTPPQTFGFGRGDEPPPVAAYSAAPDTGYDGAAHDDEPYDDEGATVSGRGPCIMTYSNKRTIDREEAERRHMEHINRYGDELYPREGEYGHPYERYGYAHPRHPGYGQMSGVETVTGPLAYQAAQEAKHNANDMITLIGRGIQAAPAGQDLDNFALWVAAYAFARGADYGTWIDSVLKQTWWTMPGVSDQSKNDFIAAYQKWRDAYGVPAGA